MSASKFPRSLIILTMCSDQIWPNVMFSQLFLSYIPATNKGLSDCFVQLWSCSPRTLITTVMCFQVLQPTDLKEKEKKTQNLSLLSSRSGQARSQRVRQGGFTPRCPPLWQDVSVVCLLLFVCSSHFTITPLLFHVSVPCILHWYVC